MSTTFSNNLPIQLNRLSGLQEEGFFKGLSPIRSKTSLAIFHVFGKSPSEMHLLNTFTRMSGWVLKTVFRMEFDISSRPGAELLFNALAALCISLSVISFELASVKQFAGHLSCFRGVLRPGA